MTEMLLLALDGAAPADSIPADVEVGWVLGILSVGAVFLARFIATKTREINDKIPKG